MSRWSPFLSFVEARLGLLYKFTKRLDKCSFIISRFSAPLLIRFVFIMKELNGDSSGLFTKQSKQIKPSNEQISRYFHPRTPDEETPIEIFDPASETCSRLEELFHKVFDVQISDMAKVIRLT